MGFGYPHPNSASGHPVISNSWSLENCITNCIHIQYSSGWLLLQYLASAAYLDYRSPQQPVYSLSNVY